MPTLYTPPPPCKPLDCTLLQVPPPLTPPHLDSHGTIAHRTNSTPPARVDTPDPKETRPGGGFSSGALETRPGWWKLVRGAWNLVPSVVESRLGRWNPVRVHRVLVQPLWEQAQKSGHGMWCVFLCNECIGIKELSRMITYHNSCVPCCSCSTPLCCWHVASLQNSLGTHKRVRTTRACDSSDSDSRKREVNVVLSTCRSTSKSI